MNNTIAAMMETTAKRFCENRLSDICGYPVKFTKSQFDAYCKATAEQEHRDEIESAIELLEREGYSVKKRRRA